jgi:hypothetical protein
MHTGRGPNTTEDDDDEAVGPGGKELADPVTL